jgi:exosortase/archaeosortase family protein
VHRHPPSLLRSRSIAICLAALGVLLILERRQSQLTESWVQSRLLGLFGLPVHRIQSAVLFTIDGKLTGISLTAGCTIGPLLGLFFLLTSVACWFRAFALRRVVFGALELVAVFLVANQIRITAIVASMRHWGFQRGYEFSHVFLGSAITTIGFVVGAIVFVRLMMRRSEVAA